MTYFMHINYGFYFQKSVKIMGGEVFHSPVSQNINQSLGRRDIPLIWRAARYSDSGGGEIFHYFGGGEIFRSRGRRDIPLIWRAARYSDCRGGEIFH